MRSLGWGFTPWLDGERWVKVKDLPSEQELWAGKT